MKILISGSTGHIGSRLIDHLRKLGHEVYRLVRSKSLENENAVYMNFANGDYDIKRFEGFDVIIHLAGENILGRWTKRKKDRIENSRVNSTKMMVDVLGQVNDRPDTFICASAVGFYGDRGDMILTEQSDSGNGFLPEVSEKWENEAAEAEKLGIRVVNLRTGMVLDPDEGALKKMVLPFKLGVGGNLGSGNQYWSWISIDDEIAAIEHIINNKELKGPVNLVSPEPSRNREFTVELGKILYRPAFMHVPEFVLNTILGDMSRELFLCSTRVLPEKLLSSGFKFKHNSLRKVLEEYLG